MSSFQIITNSGYMGFKLIISIQEANDIPPTCTIPKLTPEGSLQLTYFTVKDSKGTFIICHGDIFSSHNGYFIYFYSL